MPWKVEGTGLHYCRCNENYLNITTIVMGAFYANLGPFLTNKIPPPAKFFGL
jgi:hypothetical protein